MAAAKDHLGNDYASKTDMCAAWGLTLRTFNDRAGKGWTLQQILETPPGASPNPRRCRGCKPVADHLGRQYPSAANMCSAWAIAYPTYLARRLRGWTLRDALVTEPDAVDHNPKACTDHTGKQYPDVGAMCAAWGINRSTYYHRIQDNWSTEAALTVPVVKRAKAARAQACRDHMGNLYPSITDMCQAWGVRYNTFAARRKRGLSLRDALAAPAASCP